MMIKMLRMQAQLPIIQRILHGMSIRKHNNDTIFALATGIPAAVAIVRIAGPKAYRVLQLTKHKPSQSQSKSKVDLAWNEQEQISQEQAIDMYKIRPRFMHLREFYTIRQHQMLIDKGMLVYFPEGKSYCGLPMFELHLHGSLAVYSLLSSQLKLLDFRMAERGEFTRVAVQNRKISVMEAQSIHDLIRSQTQVSRKVAAEHLLGKGKQYLLALRTELIRVLAWSQAYLDFGQDQVEITNETYFQSKRMAAGIIKEVTICDMQINKILVNSQLLISTRDGVSVTLIGAPNSGKSTLMNRMTTRRTSIVSSIPGTTRDPIQATIELHGLKIKMVDTAGIREVREGKGEEIENHDIIEQEGIERAYGKAEESNVVVALIDLRNANQQNIIDIHDKLGDIMLMQKTIIFGTMADLLQDGKKNAKYSIRVIRGKEIQGEQQQEQDELKQKHKQKNKQKQIASNISALDGYNMEKANELLLSQIRQYLPSQTSMMFTRQRYLDGLQACAQYLAMFMQQKMPDMACEHARSAVKQVQQLLGEVQKDDVLDVIFRQFCIGK